MKIISKINIFATIIGLIYFTFLSAPLLKSIIGSKKVRDIKTTEWVEEPMMIEEI